MRDSSEGHPSMPEPPRLPGEGASQRPDLSAITLRPVRAADRQFLHQLADHLWPGEGASSLRRAAIAELERALETEPMAAEPARYWFLATDARGLALGVLSLRIEGGSTPRLARVVVAVMAIAGGIDSRSVGSAMLAFAEDWATEQGATEVALEHFADPQIGMFYEALGYMADTVRRVKRLDQ